MTPALLVEDLTVEYPTGVVALRSLDLVVADGEAVALTGESGSGKSTVVRAVLGLLPRGTRVSGRILVGGHDMTTATSRQLRRLRGTAVGYVAQDPYGACDPVWTVGHHVAEAWHAHRRRLPRGEVGRRLTALGIPPGRWWRRPYAWSGGMLQRATLAAATAHDPPLVLADEPTAALDAGLAVSAVRLLRARSRALLLVTHDPTVAAQCDRRVDLTPAVLAPLPASGTKTVGGQPVVELSGVTLVAGRRRVLARGVELAVRPGEIVGVVGPSGTGKTTLLHALAGLRPIGAGTVRYEGRPSPPPGYVMPVFQDAAAGLDPRWPIWRTVAEPLMAPDRVAASDLLHRVGLSTVDPQARPHQLSGGQQQRVAIARALAAQPALLVADEPVARLDPAAAAGVYALLAEAAATGMAVVIASHDTARLARTAHRLVRLTPEGLRPIP